MNRKTNFLHNPRHSAHAHSNTASSGPLKIRKQKQGKEKEDSRKLFIAEPPEILFTGYHPGETYEVHCVTTNTIRMDLYCYSVYLS